MNYALIDLGVFLRSPVVIAWSIVVAAVTLAEPDSIRPAHPRGALLALGVALFCLGCCYFEYFTHQFAAGGRLVERAQNEALILLSFGMTLSISLLTRAYRRQLRQMLAWGGSMSVDSVALPAALAGLMLASLY